MYFGFAYHHLNRPKNSFYQNPAVELDPKIVFSAALRSGVNDYSYFTLYADYSRQGSSTETIGGVLYPISLARTRITILTLFTLGTFLRWNDALIPVIKLEMNSFSLGLSYDVNVSRLNTVSDSRGGFELSLSYTGLLDRNRERTPAGFHDPRF